MDSYLVGLEVCYNMGYMFFYIPIGKDQVKKFSPAFPFIIFFSFKYFVLEPH